MIVQPDFLDHWKTLRLASVLSDQMAPVYVIRLWGYVQTRRCDLLPDDAETVKAICRWPGTPMPFCEALVSCGWLERTESGLLVHGWSELNARLIHNWTVGVNGGRPRMPDNKPKGKPKGKPKAEPNETDKIGVDKIGLDRIGVDQHLTPDGGKVRTRNLHMDALSEADGGPDGIPRAGWKRIATALAEIRTATPDVTPEEIRKRISNYKTHFESCACTSTALVKHWAACANPKPQYGNPANRTPVQRLVNTWVDPNPPPEYKNAF